MSLNAMSLDAMSLNAMSLNLHVTQRYVTQHPPRSKRDRSASQMHAHILLHALSIKKPKQAESTIG
jgi:hypothetical protein